MNLANALRTLRSADTLAVEDAKDICQVLGIADPDAVVKHLIFHHAQGSSVTVVELIWHMAAQLEAIHVDGEASKATLIEAIEDKLIETGRIDIRCWWTMTLDLVSPGQKG